MAKAPSSCPGGTAAQSVCGSASGRYYQSSVNSINLSITASNHFTSSLRLHWLQSVLAKPRPTPIVESSNAMTLAPRQWMQRCVAKPAGTFGRNACRKPHKDGSGKQKYISGTPLVRNEGKS